MDSYEEHDLTPMKKAVLACVAGIRTPEQRRSLESVVEAGQLHQLREMARCNKVEALVGAAIQEAYGNDFLDSGWLDLLDANEKRVVRALDLASETVEILHKKGFPTAVIEGGGTLLASTLPLSSYGAGDFDLIANPADINEVWSLLEAEGFQPKDRRSRPTARKEFYFDFGQGQGTWLEVGAQIFDRMWVPISIPNLTADWLGRARNSPRVPSLSVLDASDALALVAVHTSMHSFVRSPYLRLHLDVHRTVVDNSIDWDRFMGNVCGLEVPTRIFTSLLLSKTLLDTPIPEDILRELQPNGLRWRAIRSLIQRESIFATDFPKLKGAKAAFLDVALDDRGPTVWAHSVVLPPTDWMRQRFDPSFRGRSTISLHLRRYLSLTTKWRREVQ